MERTIIKNGKIILADDIWEGGTVILEDGIITSVTKEPVSPTSSDNIIDAGGNYVSPGFIDIHTHGAGGADFMDATVDAYLTVAETHARFGTTALLPTTLTSTDEELFYTFDIYKQANKRNKNGAKFLGLHLEGPYFAYDQRGAQDAKYLRIPNDPAHYNKILDRTDDIVRWSIAPELEGALELGKVLQSKNIIASVAHTDALATEVIEAHKAGYNLMTHFYSGMSTVMRKNAYRYAGAIEAGYLLDDMYVEIIADGIHLPKELLQLIYKVKGKDRIILVTDSMRAAGMPNGIYKLGSLECGQDVIVEDGVAKLPDRSAFAGSVATANRLVKTMNRLAEVPLVEAVRMLSLIPARIMKIDKQKGSIEEGKDADIVIFDKDIEVQATIVEGKCVYRL